MSGLLDPLAVPAVTHEQPKWLSRPSRVAGIVVLQAAVPTDVQHLDAGLDQRSQHLQVGERFEVRLEVFAAGDAIAIVGEGVFGVVRAKGLPPQQRGVHAEWAEEANVAPMVQVFADAAALKDGHGQAESVGVQQCLQANRAGAENGDPRTLRSGHTALLRRSGFPA